MQHILEQPPIERLPGLASIRESGEQVMAIANLPKYACPHCDELTVFSLETARHSPSSESCFTDDVLRLFNAASGDATAWESIHIDFHCRVCKQPVRVVCNMFEFAMGSYRHIPLKVFELSCST